MHQSELSYSLEGLLTIDSLHVLDFALYTLVKLK